MTDRPDSISTTLLGRVRQRDDRAWARLVDLFRPLVRNWARRGGVRDADLDDVAQEVFVKVAKSLDSFRRDRPGDTFVGWLRTLTRHRVADYHARKGAPAAGGTAALQALEQIPESPDLSLDLEAETAVRSRAVELLQGEFEPRTWQAFHATAVEGRPADIVASNLGMSIGAVYVAKSRVLKRLREELDGLLSM